MHAPRNPRARPCVGHCERDTDFARRVDDPRRRALERKRPIVGRTLNRPAAGGHGCEREKCEECGSTQAGIVNGLATLLPAIAAHSCRWLRASSTIPCALLLMFAR